MSDRVSLDKARAIDVTVGGADRDLQFKGMHRAGGGQAMRAVLFTHRTKQTIDRGGTDLA